uniref:Class I SAM-dependent methyltransferase n=1 Tax=Thermodesulfobacterium geofontis TaxID=1295609 RepID=A0A7C4JSS7_9BACT
MYHKTKCPICETEIEKQGFKEIYVSPYNNQEYKRYECLTCDVHWWEPLKIIPGFYENEVFEDYIAFHEVVGTRLNENHKAFFKYFPSNVRGRLLDVGCGDGRFIKHAKETGFEVWGIDFDRKSVENVKRNLGLDTVFAMSLEEFYQYAKEKGLKFDVITFFEVLEHQDKSKEFLQMVKELLKDGGYIAGSVPNRESKFIEDQRKIYRKYYRIDFDHPSHHFLRFSKFALKKALSLYKFKNIKVYELDFTIEDVFFQIEKKFLGNLDKFKNKFKGVVLRNERKAKYFTVEEIAEVTPNKIGAYSLKILKFIKNLILLLFTLPYLGKLSKNGLNLYFEATL